MTPQAVAVADLSVSLGSARVLDSISFSAAEGDFIAILGPNGAGKSTLLKAILGLTSSSGEVTIHGLPAAKAPPEWIGYVPQVKTLDKGFPAVTCELVASGMRRRWPARVPCRRHDEVGQALKLVGAEHFSHQPLGWLSGGELQRVYLARALVRQPRLLLLDEPATGIDLAGEDDMYHYLESYTSRVSATVLMVTHDWLTARHHAGRALLLNRRLISYGPPQQALSDTYMRQAFSHVGHQHASREAPRA